MINRVILLVIDGFGIGALPDAGAYGDDQADTIGHLAEAVGGLSLPNFESLGLGHVAPIKGVRSMAQPIGCFGRLGFSSRGKDSVVGHWELSGVIVKDEMTVCRSGIPTAMMEIVERIIGRKTIGNTIASMAAALSEYGSRHIMTKAPIVWTDGDNTCFLAVHEAVMPAADLQQRCREIRKVLKDAGVWIRVVAQPVSGEPGTLQASKGRRDFVSEPPGLTMLDVLNRSGQITMGLGKVYDLFSGRGFTKSFAVASAMAALDEVIGMLNKVPRGLLYATLDLLPEEPTAAATALEAFDRRLPDLFEKLRVGDMVIVTGDHGRDLSRPRTMPTREYVPVFVTSPKLAQGVDLGSRQTAADVAQTIVEALRAERLPIGESFLDALRPG